MQKKYLLLVVLMLVFKANLTAQSKLHFGSIDSLFAYAEKNSAVIKSGSEQALLAKWTRLAALGNTVNLRSPIYANYTYNTELPVNYIPAEVFGGPEGTVKALSFGQTYVSAYGFTPQIDIINPSAWARVKSASVNEKLTETTNLISKKNLLESIAAAYFNIASLQKQLDVVKDNLTAADSIFKITGNKFNEGIIREQDKNNAEINFLTVKDKMNQVNLSLQQQYNALKLLCEIPESTVLSITNTSSEIKAIGTAGSKSDLLERQQNLQMAYLKSELKSSRLLSFAPTVSLLFNQAWQVNSNTSFFDANSNRFGTQYIGLKVSAPFPFDVNRLTQNYTTKINYTLAKINNEHTKLQNQTNNAQLDLDFEKAQSGYNSAKKIAALKELNYQKSLNQYVAGILSTENLLLSFTDNLNSRLIFLSAEALLNFTQSKISINNIVQ
ncbi:MAG: TolC family protein [Bacteroidetes bacterium]|nr:TolC family protein [Bacteroidota bacterium]